MLHSRWFRGYFLPGFVFQSIVIAGGYGTGRELVEFFLNYGTLGGLLAMWLVSTVIWSAVCAVTFELARMTRSYEYRKFCRQLLGSFWWPYEVCYLLVMVIVLSVIAAAAGAIVQQIFSLPYYVGVVLMMFAVGFLTLKGTALVEKFFSFWSFVLYAVYIVFLYACFRSFGSDIVAGLSTMEVKPGWFRGGIEYAAYNVGTLPAVLFTIRHLERRREALVSGILAGPIAIIPGFLFFLAMAGDYPHILGETVPSVFLLNRVGSTLLLFAFQIMLFGTLVETGTGLIHAFNERIASAIEERGRTMPSSTRPLVAIVLLVIATFLAQVGLENLIAKGYRAMTYGFWVVFLIPVLTWGAYRVFTTVPATTLEAP
jgi:uncharacterized membrane protein YkvI